MTSLAFSGRPAEILLAEDNDNDVELTRISFIQAQLSVTLHRVPNGEECMAFLRKEGRYAGSPTPDLLLLDLNMPRMDGFEVLQAVRRDDRVRNLVIVVLTSSEADRDVLLSYDLRCNSYIVKPMDLENFYKVIKSLGDFWFTMAVLPDINAQDLLTLDREDVS